MFFENILHLWYLKGRHFCYKKLRNRVEAKEYDKHAIGIYKTEEEERETLVGHAPIELSLLLFYFLQNNKDNMLHDIFVEFWPGNGKQTKYLQHKMFFFVFMKVET